MGKKKSRTSEDDDDVVVVEEVTDETRCGLGPICSGSRMQRFATKKSYLLTYSFLGLFQSMFFSYSIATLTTLEKQFKLKSQTTGILLSGNECSQILLSLVMTYFGGQGHRPRLAAIGVFFSGISSLLIVVPHFMYGRATLVTNGTRNLDVCHVSDDYYQPTMGPSDCTGSAADSQPIGPMVYIFMSQFISGIGTTLFSILGITYLDDNVKRKQTPMLIGLMSALRLIGPALGYGLAGICIRRYVNLSETTTLKPTDPAWIGAWWLGFLVIGISQLSTCWLLALFPRRLPKITPLLRLNSTMSNGSAASANSRQKKRTLKEFPVALKRLLMNKILILNNLSGVFFIFALSGYITFLPKYIETQFQQSAARSGMVNGGISIVFMCTGLLLFGYLISRFRPSAVKLQLWDVFVGLVWCALLITFAFVSCNSKPIHGLNQFNESTGPMLGMPPTPCNQDCNCQANRFAPACSEDGLTNFFSACHAGCTKSNFSNGQTIFSDCSCIKEWRNSTDDDPEYDEEPGWVNGQAVGGYCPSNCFQIFLIYVLTMGFVKFLSSAGRVGNVIIGFRCVPPEDKSFAIGLGYLFISLFAFIPAPIVYGAVIDQACILWRTDACGVRGNCWIYDPEKMRLYLHILTASFVFLGVVADAFGAYAVRGLKLYDEDPEVDPTTPSTNGTSSKSAVIAQANRELKELRPMLSNSATTLTMITPNEDELLKTLHT